MRLSLATLTETVAELGTRMLSSEKGYELDYEAGVLIVRREGNPRVWLFPTSKVARMETDRDTLEAQFPKLRPKPKDADKK